MAWTTAAGSEITVQPASPVASSTPVRPTARLQAFAADGCEADTCPILWTADAGAPVQGNLAVFDGRLYVGTADALAAFGLPPG